LLTPSRRRQRLPVQLRGQLQRPCRVLGAATDSWSLQRRCSAAMTRCGRARLAAGATEIVSIPRLVGIRALCRWSQHRLGPLLFRLKRHPITRNLPGAGPITYSEAARPAPCRSHSRHCYKRTARPLSGRRRAPRRPLSRRGPPDLDQSRSFAWPAPGTGELGTAAPVQYPALCRCTFWPWGW
jgi:hypothetical protein